MEPLIISNSELVIMKELWREAPLTTPELTARVRQVCDWDESTVKTLLSRMVDKGMIRQDGRKRFYRYSPLVSREHYREAAGERLAEQAFDSNHAELVSFFVKKSKLTPDDISELKKLLEELENHA